MKKRYYAITNILLSSLIAMLGLGACKTSKKAEALRQAEMREQLRMDSIARDHAVKMEERARQIEEQERLKREARKKELKVVYGPPPVKYVPVK